MKKWNIDKLVVSTMIFLFTSMAAMPMLAQAGEEGVVKESWKQSTAAFTKAAMDAPYVRTSTPKIAKMDNLGLDDVDASRLFVRSVDDSQMITDSLLKMPLYMADDLASTTDQSYGNEEGAFVSLGDSTLMRGLMSIDNINPEVGDRVADLLDNPEAYGVDADALDVSIAPKLIEVANLSPDRIMEKSHLLAMDPSVGDDVLTKSGLETLLTRAYSAFKGYSDIIHHRTVNAPVEINTSFWAAQDNPELAKVSTTIQMIAAQLAGVDNLVFHEAGLSPDAVDQARAFLDAHNGESVSSILDALLLEMGGGE